MRDNDTRDNIVTVSKTIQRSWLARKSGKTRPLNVSGTCCAGPVKFLDTIVASTASLAVLTLTGGLAD